MIIKLSRFHLGMFLAIVRPADFADLDKLSLIILLPHKSILSLMEDLVVVRLGDANKLAILHYCGHHLERF